jgi:hypothetical protein
MLIQKLVTSCLRGFTRFQAILPSGVGTTVLQINLACRSRLMSYDAGTFRPVVDVSNETGMPNRAAIADAY